MRHIGVPHDPVITMKRILYSLFFAALAGGTIAWWLTGPSYVDPRFLDGVEASPERGALVFAASGCASCHSAPDTTTEDRLVLAGGRAFASPFGTFFAPNISSDPVHGIGEWSQLDLANALLKGTSPKGQHYYPALPYTAYRTMTAQDVVDLASYLRTLPASPQQSQAHDIGFPFNIRRSLGGWKLLFFTDDYVMDAATPQLERGRYLVETLGHCAECHTPRNALGGLDRTAWMQGAPNPSGKGTIPPLTPDKLGWTFNDVAAFLKSGLTPEFDSAGGEMTEVIENMKELPDSDLQAIAAYLLSLPSAE